MNARIESRLIMACVEIAGLAVALALVLMLADLSSAQGNDVRCPTLRCAAKRLGILVGTDLYYPPGYYVDSTALTKMGRITADNFNAGWIDLSWKSIEPSPGKFDFSYTDAQVKWAEDNGIQPWGHALIYPLQMDPAGEFTPAWLRKEKDPTRIRNHFQRRITTLMKRYKGRMRQWIILNEGYESGHEDNWQKLLGDYASFVFRVAREADPSAQLIYNEAQNENATGYHSVNRESTDRIVKELTPHGLLDMLCFQAHIAAAEELDVSEFLSYVKKQKVPVCISELDFNLHGYPGTKAQRYQYQARKVAEIVNGALEVSVKAIFFWDVGDANSWLVNGTYSVAKDADPTLWDKQLNPKPVFFSVKAVLEERARRLNR